MRPQPPAHMLDYAAPLTFRADAELEQWARATFISPDGELANEDHYHLVNAKIGMVWTTHTSKRHGRAILGQCEMIMEATPTWQKARGLHLLQNWFDGIPDFVITLYAPAAAEMDDRNFCALVSHELYHAGQKLDDHGNPSFSTETGEPLFCLRGHDFEEFLGVVNQFGATSNALRSAAEAIMAGPLLEDASIEIACGSCRVR